MAIGIGWTPPWMMGFPIRPIGPVGDYFGNVRPHAVDLREMERKLRDHCPEVWAFFQDRSEDIHTMIIRAGEWKTPTGKLAVAA